MKQNPILSVITVTYNAIDTLKRTLESVNSQSYSLIEYIIVDGGSTDGSLDLIKQYEQIVTTFISEPDGGLYDAMNKAIDLATGDYLCFLNAGDTFHDDTSVTQLMSFNDVCSEYAHRSMWPGVLYADTAIVDGKGHFLHLRTKRPPNRLTWRSFKKGMVVCHQTFIARRDLVTHYDLQYRFSADFDWCIKVMKHAEIRKLPLKWIDLILIDYLNEGLTTKNHKASLKERFSIMRKYYGLWSTLYNHLLFFLKQK